MENPNLPKVVPVPAQWKKRYGTGSMLVPSPRDVEKAMRSVRPGGLLTVAQIRQRLARQYSTDVTCPLTTGIFVRIASEAAEEDRRAGKSRITPYWRIVKDDGSLNPKLPGGVARQAQLLRAEGHQILPGQGKRPPRVASRTSGMPV
jgi:hypothetical protein